MKLKKLWKNKILAGTLCAAVLCSGFSMVSFAKTDGGDKIFAGNTSVKNRFSAEKDYTQYVDPFVATAVDNGQQFPGAVSPYGIVKLSPDTYPHVNDDHAGYDYNASKIAGFSHTRIEGVGGQGAGGDVLVTPTYVEYTKKPTMDSRAQSFSHEKESATAGCYSVELTPNTGTDTAKQDTSFGNIQAELTSTTRTGFHKYTFPKEGRVSLVTDLNYTYHGMDIRDAKLDVSKTKDGRAVLSGRFSGKNVSGHGKYTMYFYMETDTPVADIHTWNGSRYGTEMSHQGNDLGSVLSFDVKKGQCVQIKVGISPISSEQAKIDMQAEDAGWDFAAVRADAKDAWNEILGKVDVDSSSVSDPDGSLTKLFYTHLYRMFQTPVNATSTSGTYRGTDGKVYQAEGYTHYDSWTLWDDFRKYPMIGLIAPDIYKDIIQSVADMLNTGIDAWGNDSQPVLTVRNEHAVALLADGVSKGYTDIKGLNGAYEATKKIADNAVNSSVEKQGYFTGRVDQTVEYAYDDWALSLIAKALGKTDEQQYYLQRSYNYKNLYRADAVQTADGYLGLLWPKDSAGNWMSADPERYGDNGLYQGTLWQYTWWDTNDVGGLMTLMGGKENMLKALNTLYGAKGADADGKKMLHSNTNEIDLQTPYLFNYAGKPSETQYWVRQIYTGKTWNRYSGTGEYNPPRYEQVYKLSPDGLMQTMDDDAGTMAAMYVSAAMGLFPMNPGDATFQIGTPFFEKMTLDLGKGKTFTIHAENVSPENYYIQSASLNGSSLDRTWLDYNEIAQGGDVTFKMGAKASDWAEDGVTAPSSSDKQPASAYTYEAVYDKTDIAVENGNVDASVPVKLQGGASFSDSTKDVSVEGLPKGVTMTADRTDDQTLTLHFKGQIKDVQSEYEIYDLQITLGDGVFAGGVKASQVKNASMSSMSALRLNNTMIPSALTVKAPEKTTYKEGEELNLSGGTVTVMYGKNTFTREIPLSSEELTVGELPKQIGELEIPVSYRGLKGSFKVNREEILLSDIIAEANEMLEKANLSQQGFAELQAAVDEAEAIDRYPGVTKDEKTAEMDKLKAAMEKAAAGSRDAQTSAYDRLEAENKDDWSGGALKTETSTDSASGTQIGNVGATYDKAWLKYTGVDFGSNGAKQFSVRYVNNSGRCGANNRLEIYLDAMDGEPLQTISIPATANNWNAYATVTADLEKEITGVHDLYLVMRTDGGNAGYVANFDWFSFTEKANTTQLKLEAESKTDWSGNGLKIENGKDAAGNSLTNLGGTTNDAWLKFAGCDFGNQGMTEFAIRYVNNSSRCGNNNRVEIYLDSMEGTPYTTVPIPATGSNWNAYDVVQAQLDKAVTGTHDVYFKLKTDGGNAGYVANIDWFSFSRNVALENLKSVYADAQDILKEKADYDEADVQQLQDAVTAAETLLKKDSASQEEYQGAMQKLNRAMGRMHKLADVSNLKSLLEKAKTADSTHWTTESKEALKAAVSYGEDIVKNTSATQAQVTLAEQKLQSALDHGQDMQEGNKKVLNAQISQGTAVGPTGYTETSYAALQDALKKAETVSKDRWAQQDDIEAAVTAIKTAVKELKEK